MAERIMILIILVLLIAITAETLRLGVKKGIFKPLNPFRWVKVLSALKLSRIIAKTRQSEAYKKASGANEVWNNIWQGRLK